MNPRTALAAFGEWIHHAAAITITAETGGPGLTAAYMAAYVAPAHLIRVSWPRWLRWLSPLAFFGAALLPTSPWLLILMGTVAGMGRAAAGRPGAWLFGLEDGVGVPAVLGAAVGTALLTSSVQTTFIAAAVAVAISRPGTLTSSAPAGPFTSAALAGCIVIGMRVLEPTLLVDPIGGAVFSLAWVSGASLGARWGKGTDPRPVAAAPFLAAASIALMGSIDGPGMLLLWAATGACTVMVITGARGTGRPGHAVVALGVVGASAVTAVAGPFILLPSALWFAAACLLTGGFISLAMLARATRRVPVPTSSEVQAASALAPVGSAGGPAVAAEEVASAPGLEEVAAMLLDAIRSARAIRAEAIAEVRRSIDPFQDLKGQALQVIGSLSVTVDEVRARLAAPVR